MAERQDIIDALQTELPAFRTEAVDLCDGAGDRLDRANEPAAFDGPAEFAGFETLDEYEQELVWRLWVLDDAPFGLALSGPAFQENPIIYATRTVQDMTGYSLSEIRGENLRLLQGPATDDDPFADLREAIDIWEAVTVELQNYRKDGTQFRNRVSLVPMSGPAGTISNWIGVQEVVDPEFTGDN
jgi:PAS domain S-box-containing protein